MNGELDFSDVVVPLAKGTFDIYFSGTSAVYDFDIELELSEQINYTQGGK